MCKDIKDEGVKVHGNKFDYSNAVYTGSKNKVKITCNICKTDFETRWYAHLQSVLGCCPTCRYKKVAGTLSEKFKSNVDEFIVKAKKVHGDKYNYDKVVYKRSHIKIIITCSIHGDFEQRPNDHLIGKKCGKCANLEKGSYRKLSTEQFITKAKEVHKHNEYDYSKVVYKNNFTDVYITCNKCNNTFTQRPHNHTEGKGCPSCAKPGFDPTKPAILYYISVLSGTAYKIGITNKDIETRFARDIENIKVLKTWEYPIGYDARAAETNILSTYKEYKYTGRRLLIEAGDSELFYKDILDLDSDTF